MTLTVPSKPVLLVLGGGLVAIVGAFGPWVDTLFGSVSGTRGDGLLCLIAAGLAMILAFTAGRTSRPGAVICLIAAVVAAGTAG
jgi:hypothetical protein